MSQIYIAGGIQALPILTYGNNAVDGGYGVHFHLIAHVKRVAEVRVTG